MDVRRDDYAEAFARLTYKRARIYDERQRALAELDAVESTERRLRDAALRSRLFRDVAFRPDVRRAPDGSLVYPSGVHELTFSHHCGADDVSSYAAALGGVLVSDGVGMSWACGITDADGYWLGNVLFGVRGPSGKITLQPKYNAPALLVSILEKLGAKVLRADWETVRADIKAHQAKVLDEFIAEQALSGDKPASRPLAHVADFPKNVDWAMLRDQMDALSGLYYDQRRSAGPAAEKRCEAIEGVLNLLGTLKDYAADVCGINEELVFGPREEFDDPDSVVSKIAMGAPFVAR